MPSFQGRKWTTERILQKLNGKRIKTIELWDTAADDDLLIELARQGRLTSASIDSQLVTDKGVADLASGCPLKSLHLWNSSLVTDDAMPGIVTCQTLRELYLDGTSVTDAGVAPIGKLPDLWSLSLCNTAVTDQGIESIAGRSIHLVSIMNCAIAGGGFASWRHDDKFSLYAEGSQIDDKGFGVVCQTFPELWGLILSHTRLGDAGLLHLLGQGPTSLKVYGSPVTRNGVLWLIENVLLLQALEVDPTQMSKDEAARYQNFRREYFRLSVYEPTERGG